MYPVVRIVILPIRKLQQKGSKNKQQISKKIFALAQSEHILKDVTKFIPTSKIGPILLLSANEVWGEVMFSQVSVRGGAYTPWTHPHSQHVGSTHPT